MRRRPSPMTSREAGNRWRSLHWVAGSLLVAAAFAVVMATATGPAGAQEPEGSDPRWDSQRCLGCHDGSTASVEFASGERLSVAVDGQAFTAAPHAAVGVECVHCHATVLGFPHEAPSAQNTEEYRTQLSTSCRTCHWTQYTIMRDGAHALIDVQVRESAPTCIDCHDSHEPRALAVDHPQTQATCAGCHTDEGWDEVEAIHVFNPTRLEEAEAPPLILFYGLIAGAVVLLVGLAWAAVGLLQWARRRPATSDR